MTHGVSMVKSKYTDVKTFFFLLKTDREGIISVGIATPLSIET